MFLMSIQEKQGNVKPGEASFYLAKFTGLWYVRVEII
jgi:hypothetical protein